MKQFLLLVGFVALTFSGIAQNTTIVGKRIIARESLQLVDHLLNGITANINSSDSLDNKKIPTGKAVADYVRLNRSKAVATLQSVIDAGTFAITSSDVSIQANDGLVSAVQTTSPSGFYGSWFNGSLNSEFSITSFGVQSQVYDNFSSASSFVSTGGVQLTAQPASGILTSVELGDRIELRTLTDELGHRLYVMDNDRNFYITHNEIGGGLASAGFAIMNNFRIKDTAYKNNANKDSVLSTDITGNFEMTLREGYKVYTAILRCESGFDPVATILKNTLGNVDWQRSGVGEYSAALIGGFPAGKVWISVSNEMYTLPGLGKSVSFKRASNNGLSGTARTYTNDAADQWEVNIEIRVYP